MAYEIKTCGDCEIFWTSGIDYCASRSEPRNRVCTACGWAESWSGDELGLAKRIWNELEDVTVDEDNLIDVDFTNPIVGHFMAGDAYPEDIWREIERRLHVSVAYLMGLAKNPDGSGSEDK